MSGLGRSQGGNRTDSDSTPTRLKNNCRKQNPIAGIHITPSRPLATFIGRIRDNDIPDTCLMQGGVPEMIAYGEYRELDLSGLGYQRVLDNQPFLEKAVI